jgi:RNA polymerase sigma factor (sigma-70 family)
VVSELFDSARAGDRAAQAEVHRRIRSFARAVVRGGSAATGEVDWEDVAQEASGKLFATGLLHYRGRGSEDSYLYSIVKTTAITLARGSARRRARERDFVRTLATSAVNPGPLLDVKAILLQLTDECRSLVARVFLGGASYPELAREAGIVESSVRAKLSRCIRKARELATKEGTA